MKINLLNTLVDIISPQNLLTKIDNFILGKENGNYLITINPEMILYGQKNPNWQKIINQANLVIPDGVGIQYASRYLYGVKIPRYPGANLIIDILKKANEKKLKVLIIIGDNSKSSIKDIEQIFKKYFSAVYLKIIQLSFEKKNEKISLNNNVIQEIIDFNPIISLVSLGVPFQEKLIFDLFFSRKIGKLSLGVGGAIDFLTGKIKRAPKIFQKIGLEWAFRFYQEPKYRARRIFRAVITFPIKIFLEKFRQLFIYNKNVVAVILNNDHQILLTNYRLDLTHWKFPQGGVDQGETEEVAIKRELKEELGTDKFVILKKCPQNYYYKITDKESWFKSGFKKKKQTIFIVKFLGQYQDICLDKYEAVKYQWVDQDKILTILHPYRQEVAKIALKNLANLVT